MAVPKPLNLQEIQRKAQSGLKLSNPTPEALKAYEGYKSKLSYDPNSVDANGNKSVEVLSMQYQDSLKNGTKYQGVASQPVSYSNGQVKEGDTVVHDRNNPQAFKDYKQRLNRGNVVAPAALKSSRGQLTQATQTNTGKIPPPQFNPIPIPTDADRAAEARRRVQMAIEERRRQTEQQKTGNQTSYNRAREDIGDDRVLEDVRNERRLDPFSGRSDYALGMIARERGRSDREMQQDLLTRQANADQGLADFEKLSFEEQQRLIDQFKREDRDYGLRANDQQFNQYDRNRNFDRGVYEDDRDFNRGAYESDRGYNRGVTESDRNFDYQQARDQIQDKRYQQEFDENQRRYGLEYATKKAMEDKQLSLSWYNAKTSRQNSNNSANSNETNRLMDIWKATGVAPKGIEGVAEGTPWQSGGGTAPKSGYQENTDWQEDFASIVSNPQEALTEIRSRQQELIATYGYEGFKALEKRAIELMEGE
jgi:hypothetical protein